MNASRRTVLAGLVGTTAVAIAGCLGSSDGGQSFEDHPATTGIESQPSLGSPDAPATIVAFEDPSCRSCKRFETETFPAVKSELIESGRVRFVYRTLDITFRWSLPASQLMASTYDDMPEAFWGLKRYYYARQSEFEPDNVFELTESYLREESTADADAVLEAARGKEHDALIQRNREAAEAADTTATPEFYLFRDDEFRTSVSGPQDYDVFESALGFD